MNNLYFNILTFNHPQEELTFYYTDAEQENCTRVYHRLVPDEVVEKFGEQEHYYTAFEKQAKGFYPVIKSVNPSYETIEDEKGKPRSHIIRNSALSISRLILYERIL